MTPLHHTVACDRTTSGWLRRAWEAGLATRQWHGGSHRGVEHGYLLGGAIAETLEPFITQTPVPGLDEGDTRILGFEGLDSPAAAVLLATLPAEALELDLSTYAPSPRTMLRVVADNPGVVFADGDVCSPQLPAEAVRLRTLTILDPELINVAPDVVPGALPDWIEDLSTEDYAEFMRDRQWCIDHSTTRPAWLVAAAQYRIDDARRYPEGRILTDDRAGIRGVQFAW